MVFSALKWPKNTAKIPGPWWHVNFFFGITIMKFKPILQKILCEIEIETDIAEMF